MTEMLKPHYRQLHNVCFSALVPLWGRSGRGHVEWFRTRVDGFVLDKGSEASASVVDLPDRIRSRGGEGAIVRLCMYRPTAAAENK